jgi:hypothetical protein
MVLLAGIFLIKTKAISKILRIRFSYCGFGVDSWWDIGNTVLSLLGMEGFVYIFDTLDIFTCGKWEMGNGKWEIGNRKLEMGK